MGDVINAQAIHNRGEPNLQVGIRGDAFLMSLNNGFVTITNPETGQSLNLKAKVILDTNDGEIDLEEYVSSIVAADSVPLMDGTAAFGSSNKYARMDHVHPKDTSKEDTSNKVTSLSSSSTDTQYPSAKAVYDELQTVKTSVSSGKALVAAAVTDKGVQTAADASFQTISDNIEQIQSGTDTSSDTVTENSVLDGFTFHDKDGNARIGNIPSKSSTDISVSGSTVTAPAGYYPNASSKSVASGTAKTPNTSITANPSISIGSNGKITATTSASKGITPTVSAGYISSGTVGTVSVNGSATKQLTTQSAKTVTPTTSEQTAVAAGVYTTGAVKVAAIPTAEQATPAISVGSDGKITASATQTAGYVAAGTKSATQQMTVQAAKTVTPTTSEQTAVAAGVYTTGAVKVAALEDADAVQY